MLFLTQSLRRLLTWLIGPKLQPVVVRRDHR
jgi:hypothetical protein